VNQHISQKKRCNNLGKKDEFYFEDLPEEAQEIMIELIASIVKAMKDAELEESEP
jgi:hypothetical protein